MRRVLLGCSAVAVLVLLAQVALFVVAVWQLYASAFRGNWLWMAVWSVVLLVLTMAGRR